MDIRRVALYAALALIVYSLWINWQRDYPPLPRQMTNPASSATVNGGSLLPEITHSSNNQPSTEAPTKTNAPSGFATSSQPIRVKTDVLDLTIDLQQGDIVGAQLLDYPVSVEEKDKPITLFRINLANATLQTAVYSPILTKLFKISILLTPVHNSNIN